MMSDPDPAQSLMMMDTDKPGSSAENDSQDVNVILENLFDIGLEEVIQKIFLYLDPKSLKNCKSSCSKWREFIERRIWKSKSARQQLRCKLNSGWKNEAPVRWVQLAYFLLKTVGAKHVTNALFQNCQQGAS